MRKWPWLKIIWYVILIIVAIRSASDEPERVS